ncbi:MAG: hypothetical protein ABI615_10265 [Chthoniobacterales bacterium]
MKSSLQPIRHLFIKLLPLLAIALLGQENLSAADLVVSKEPARVVLTVQREKKNKIEAGDWDDKIERLRLEVTVTYQNLNGPPLEGYQLQYWAIARLIKDPKAYEVVIADTVPIRLASDVQSRMVSHKSDEVKWGWDNTGAIWGKKFEGWIAVVLNEKGEVIAAKSSNPTWETNISKAGNLEINKIYTSKLDPSTTTASRD